MIPEGTKPKTMKLYKLLPHMLTKTAVSKHLGTGSLISTGLYGNTKIALRDQVFMTIIDYFEWNKTKYTMSPENVKSLLCLIFQSIFTTYSQLTLITYIYLCLWFHNKWAALPAPYSQSSNKIGLSKWWAMARWAFWYFFSSFYPRAPFYSQEY